MYLVIDKVQILSDMGNGVKKLEGFNTNYTSIETPRKVLEFLDNREENKKGTVDEDIIETFIVKGMSVEEFKSKFE